MFSEFANYLLTYRF